MRNFLSITDFTTDEIFHILDRADVLFENWNHGTMPQSLAERRIALWFWGQGFRNRVAFDIGARSMGAEITFMPGDLGVHEPIEDIGHYLSNWFDMAVIRAMNHDDLLTFTRDFGKPVINARTNYNHPCEILGDLQFIRRKRGSLDGLNVFFTGEVTNLCMSWFEAAMRLPITVTQVAPPQYRLSGEKLNILNRNAVGRISVAENPESAVDSSTDVIYTDCWPGNRDKSEISSLFLPYQITKETVNRMNPSGFFLPCPPVTRGEEISIDSLTSEQYANHEAKNFLLHSQNAVMEFCLNEYRL